MTSTKTQISRRSLSKFAVAGLGAAGLACATTPAASAAASDLRNVSAAQRAADSQKLLNLINNYRVQSGVRPLMHSAIAASVMEVEARRQFIQGYVAHSTQFLYHPKVQGYSLAREIISLSWQGRLEDLLDFWKSSPAHNAALLHPDANVCAIGLAYGNGSTLPWRVLGNVGIYLYHPGKGPNDYTHEIVPVAEQAQTPVTFPIVNAIAQRYHADGGENYYGKPLNAEVGGLVNGGTWQGFKKGNAARTILWSPNTGAHAVYEDGAIGHFWRAHRAEQGLGYPTMNEQGGLVGGGAYQIFRNGHRSYKVLWHPIYGTNMVYENGAIGARWAAMGYERGAGYPLTGEYVSGVEMHQRFSNGVTIAWHSFTGAVRVF